MSLSEILARKIEKMNVNPPPGAIPTSAFIVVSLLQSEYTNLCNTNDEGTAILNSTQSMTHLTLEMFPSLNWAYSFSPGKH